MIKIGIVRKSSLTSLVIIYIRYQNQFLDHPHPIYHRIPDMFIVYGWWLVMFVDAHDILKL